MSHNPIGGRSLMDPNMLAMNLKLGLVLFLNMPSLPFVVSDQHHLWQLVSHTLFAKA